MPIRKQTFTSKNEYKNNYYAGVAQSSNFRIALYSTPDGYHLDYLSLWDWASQHKQANYVPPAMRTDLGQFIGITTPGSLVLVYQTSPKELKGMSKLELSKRLYHINSLSKSDGRMIIIHHREARAITDLRGWLKSNGLPSAGVSSLDFPNLCVMLRLSEKKAAQHLLFEGIDFMMSLSGEIVFKERK